MVKDGKTQLKVTYLLSAQVQANPVRRLIGAHMQLIAKYSVFTRTNKSLYHCQQRIADFAKFDFGGIDLLDLAYTLGSRRTHFATRGFFIALRTTHFRQIFSLDDFVTSPVPGNNHNLPYAFVFTERSSQRSGLGREPFE